MTGPERVLLVGDLHGNTAASLAAIDHAARLGADVILQLGDLGFWPRSEKGRSFLAKVEKRLALRKLQMWWIDGNHEDFARLVVRSFTLEGLQEISEHLWHVQRGFRWQWGATEWLAAGGASSVDRFGRAEGVDWFAEEELTDELVEAIIADGPADVLVAHDAPFGVPLLRQVLWQDLPAWRRADKSFWPVDRMILSDEHMRRVRQIVDGVGARVVFHGHHHRRYTDTISTANGDVHIEGLGTDGMPMDALCLLVDSAGVPILAES